MLALGIGALQIMLDRGELLNWFGSTEIIVEAVLAGLGIYLFVVHMATAERPFIPPPIFANRNFVAGLGIMFAVGAILLATSALLAPYLQTLADYPVFTAGLAMAPRGLGTMAAMFLAGRLASRDRPAQGDGGRRADAVLDALGDDALDARRLDVHPGDDDHRAGHGPGLRLHPAEPGGLRHARIRSCGPTGPRSSA